MRRQLILIFAGCLVFTGALINAYAQQMPAGLTGDPGKALLIYEDVTNFLHAYKLLSAGGDAVEILKKEYFGKATPGLKQFVKKYNLTAESIAAAIPKHPEKYEALKDMPQWLEKHKDSLRKTFVKLKGIIPNALFFPTYFVVGDYRGIASGSQAGQLVSVERFTRTEQHLNTIVTHESVHLQQVMAVGVEKYQAIYGPEKSLLALTIREGAAEFFTGLITGEITQEEARDFVLKREKELWQRFSKEMHGKETGDWMWKKPADPEQPPHIGYFMGSRIAEAYYNKAKDKAQAVKDILSVTDYPAFLKRSGYAEQFEENK